MRSALLVLSALLAARAASAEPPDAPDDEPDEPAWLRGVTLAAGGGFGPHTIVQGGDTLTDGVARRVYVRLGYQLTPRFAVQAVFSRQVLENSAHVWEAPFGDVREFRRTSSGVALALEHRPLPRLALAGGLGASLFGAPDFRGATARGGRLSYRVGWSLLRGSVLWAFPELQLAIDGDLDVYQDGVVSGTALVLGAQVQ